ncbi:MAG: hypothetical protein Q4P18_06640 [Methanobrevibacter sp.]|uniref:hypothetical protein n=1 Tax=Methanobrevibacter sp. TaxID=66852 RepID=UPI0026DF6083|nr:hypothetical protein [Methanobrevibacter sp.]MDO5849193.1 hypothetical protein [Methanobrevibacter sp.]
MVGDDSGQMSVEILFLFAVSIILLLVFTLPLTQMAIENNLDVSNILNVKSSVLQLANGIDDVYAQGMGSKKVITIESPADLSILIKPRSISTEISLHDGKIKKFSNNHKAENAFSNLNLDKGVNKVLICWPDDSANIVVKRI